MERLRPLSHKRERRKVTWVIEAAGNGLHRPRSVPMTYWLTASFNIKLR